jgi:hypothetical protein
VDLPQLDLAGNEAIFVGRGFNRDIGMQALSRGFSP